MYSTTPNYNYKLPSQIQSNNTARVCSNLLFPTASQYR
jgi:hypothetical protein